VLNAAIALRSQEVSRAIEQRSCDGDSNASAHAARRVDRIIIIIVVVVVVVIIDLVVIDSVTITCVFNGLVAVALAIAVAITVGCAAHAVAGERDARDGSCGGVY
jgi:fatty-acid desaturase